MLKLTKISTNETLEFGGSIPFYVLSTILNDDVSYSLSFNAPFSYINNKIFGFIEHPEIAISNYSDAFMFDCNYFSMKVTLSMTNITAKGYECDITCSTFLEQIKTKKLTDIVKEYDYSALSQEERHEELQDTLTNENADFVCCKLSAPDIFRNLPVNNFAVVTNYPPPFLNYNLEFNYDPVDNEYTIGISDLIVPFFYLKNILQQIFSLIGVTFKSIFDTDLDFKQLCFFNTTSINDITIISEGNKTYPIYNVTNIGNNSSPMVTLSENYGEEIVSNAYVRFSGSSDDPDWNSLVDKAYKIALGGTNSFTLLGVDFTYFDTYSIITSDLHVTFCNVIESVAFDDEVNTITMPVAPAFWRTGDYVFIILYNTEVNTGNYYRIEKVDNTNFKIIGITEELFPDYVISDSEQLIINLCCIKNEYPQVIEMAKHLPDITMGEFFRELENYLFVKFVYSIFNDDIEVVKLKDVLAGSEYIDITAYCSPGYESELEDFSVKTIGYTADDNDAEFENVKELTTSTPLKGTVAAVSNLPEAGNKHNDVYFVTNLNEYWIFKIYSDDDTPILSSYGKWVFYSRNLYNKSLSGINELISAFSPVFWNRTNTGDITSFFDRDVCLYNFYNQELNNALRLFFYRGYYQSKQLATGGVLDHNHSKISTANLALDYDTDTYNIYNLLAKNWIYLNENRKEYKFNINWPPNLFVTIDFKKKYVIKGNAYLIKSIEFDILNNGDIEFGGTYLVRV